MIRCLYCLLLRLIIFGVITSHIYPFPIFKIVFERNNCKYINSYNFLEKIYREKLIILSQEIECLDLIKIFHHKHFLLLFIPRILEVQVIHNIVDGLIPQMRQVSQNPQNSLLSEQREKGTPAVQQFTVLWRRRYQTHRQTLNTSVKPIPGTFKESLYITFLCALVMK